MNTNPSTIDKLPVKIPLNDIAYIELSKIIWIKADADKTIVHSLDESAPMKCDISISDIEKILPSQTFFRTHRSSIINLKHRVKFCKFDRDVYLTDNHIVKIAEDRIHNYFILTDPAYRKKNS